jgi:hypothetical protein
MAEKSERNAAKGEDTSGLDAELAKFRRNKDQTKTNFKKDKERGNPSNDNGNSDNDTDKPDKDTGKPDNDKGTHGKGTN